MNTLNLPDNFRTDHTPSTELSSDTAIQSNRLILTPEEQRQSAARRKAFKAAQRERAKTLPPKLKSQPPKPTIYQLGSNLIDARLATLKPAKPEAQHHHETASSETEGADRTTAYIQEWRDSCVSDAIIAANVEWIEGDDAIERLTAHAIAQMGSWAQQYATGPVRQLLDRYQTAREGGWWVNGLDPLNNWEVMDWGQFKPIHPRPVFKKNALGQWEATDKSIKYEAPAKQTTRAIFLAGAVDWRQTQADITVPRIWTEGAKTAGAGLTAGHATIALPGVFSGYRSKDALGNPIAPHLIPDVQAMAQPGSVHFLAFDQDEKPETARKVAVALTRFGQLLQAQGCEVRVVRWFSSQGKGIDDLIAAHGPDAFHRAINDALTLDEWQLWQSLDNRLSMDSAIRLKVNDLTKLKPESVPGRGIIGIASAKATRKTGLIAQLIADSDKVLSAGHRISLQRYLSGRFTLDYRGDLDKHLGRFFNGETYTLRVSTVVDSLLAINPADFEGCDLVIDEVCQVLKHLLTSSTCNKDGKRPVLLMCFRELIRGAKRILLADADLDDKALRYIQALRGDGQHPFIIRNDYQAPGYAVRFIEAHDASAITGELLQDLKAGKRVFIALDTKRASKQLHRLIEALGLNDDQQLLINSDTTNDPQQRAFMENPDRHLQCFSLKVVSASPSACTGLSIEGDHFDKVYGIFYGTSITDADMAQFLMRVRADVPRVVWCAKYGRAFSKVGRETRAERLLNLLKQKTDANTLLIRSSLSELASSTLSGYDWDNDPHLHYWAEVETERNRSMWNLRAALKIRLMHEGHQVEVVKLGKNSAAYNLLKGAREDLKIDHAISVENAANLNPVEAKALKQLEGLETHQQLALQKWNIAEFYVRPVELVDADLVLWDNDGRRRGQLLNLEGLLHEEVASEADVHSLEQQAKWAKSFTQKGYTPWDIGNASLKRWMRQQLDLDTYLEREGAWDADTLADFKEKALSLAPQIKAALNFTVRADMAPVQILNQLLEQMGMKTVRSQPTQDGKRSSIYRLCPITQQINHEILERRKARRERLSGADTACTSPSYTDYELKGCANQNPSHIEDPGSVVVMSIPLDGLEAPQVDRLANDFYDSSAWERATG